MKKAFRFRGGPASRVVKKKSVVTLKASDRKRRRIEMKKDEVWSYRT